MSKALAPTPSFLISHLLGCSILWASGFLFIKLSGAVNPFEMDLRSVAREIVL